MFLYIFNNILNCFLNSKRCKNKKSVGACRLYRSIGFAQKTAFFQKTRSEFQKRYFNLKRWSCGVRKLNYSSSAFPSPAIRTQDHCLFRQAKADLRISLSGILQKAVFRRHCPRSLSRFRHWSYCAS